MSTSNPPVPPPPAPPAPPAAPPVPAAVHTASAVPPAPPAPAAGGRKKNPAITPPPAAQQTPGAVPGVVMVSPAVTPAGGSGELVQGADAPLNEDGLPAGQEVTYEQVAAQLRKQTPVPNSPEDLKLRAEKEKQEKAAGL